MLIKIIRLIFQIWSFLPDIAHLHNLILTRPGVDLGLAAPQKVKAHLPNAIHMKSPSNDKVRNRQLIAN